MGEVEKNTAESEALISPERKRQIRADLTYLQLFAFQGPRITTGDRRRPLGQLDEKDVLYEYSLGGGEWNGTAVAMTHEGRIQGQKSSQDVVTRFHPLIDVLASQELPKKKGLIALETMLDDGKLSVLMAGYANYERQRHNCPTPTGFELEFSDLRAANRFFENLGNDPTATVNEYVSAAIGVVDGGRHAAFGGKWQSAIRYLGVRRHNDEMFQAEVTDQGVKITKHYRDIEELAGEIKNREAEKPASPGRQAVGADGFPTSNEPSPQPGFYRGESKIAIPRRPPGYFSLVEKYGSLSYDGLSMEAQRNAPPPVEAPKPPERRYGVKIAALAEGEKSKVAAGKPQGREGQIIRGGDDCAFSIKAPENNPNGLMCFGVDLDGVSQGGRGDEASIMAAKSLHAGIEQFLNRAGQLDRDQVAIEVARLIAAANKQVFEEGNRRMTTTLSIFGLQESGGELYLHSWNTGDSVTMVYVQTEAGQEFLYPVTIPQDPIGEEMMREKKFEDLYTDGTLQLRMQASDNKMNIDQLQQAYQDAIVLRRKSLGQYGPQIVEQELVTVSNVVGNKPKAIVDYTRVSLPQIGESFKGSPVKQLKVVGMSDGIENYSDFNQQLQAFRQPTANGVAMELLKLGNIADADDRSVVAAEVRPRLTEAPKPIKEKSPNLKTEKEWGEAMKDMLRNPIAGTVYSQTGSLTAAAVAYERRAEISSGKMTKEQYMALVKRVLAAGKI